MKKILIILLLFFLFGSFVSASIQNYKVSSPIPLGKNLTITGNLTGGGNIFCDFYIFDDANKFIWKLTSEKASTDGTFSSTYLKVDEPLLYRGQDYNAVTNCDGNIAIAQFSVAQRENITHTTQQEIDYAFDTNNLTTFFIAGTIILMFFSLAVLGIWFYKSGKNAGGN